MERKPVLDVKIEFNTTKPVFMEGENASIVMIPFSGTVKGEIFEGIVEPCGVDTQIRNAAGIRHMSARYMLTGKDSADQDAHIYVENNGWFDENTGKMTMPFNTDPTFYTDSKVLAPYLHRAQFVGEGHNLEDGLHILFYEIEH